jgi:hypothetical protein
MSREFQKAFTSFRIAMVALCTLGIVLPPQFAAAGAATGLGAGSVSAATPLVTQVKNYKGGGKNVYVKKNVYVNKNVYVKKGGGKNWYVKRWNHKPYYGNVIAGVALGTLIGATAVGVAPSQQPPTSVGTGAIPPGTKGTGTTATRLGFARPDRLPAAASMQ